MTITTVGFGDVVPQTQSGKAFTVVFCLVGCTILAWSVNSLISYPLVMKAKQSELKVMMQFGGKLSEETLISILASDFFDRNPNLRQDENSVTKSEFILLLLSMMSKINDKDVLIISKIFDMLDEQKQSKNLNLHRLILPSSDVLSAESILSEIRRAHEREENMQEDEEIRQRELASTSANAERFLHVKRSAPKSNARRSSAPPSSSLLFTNSDPVGHSPDRRNPLINPHQDLPQPVVIPSEIGERGRGDEISQQQQQEKRGDEVHTSRFSPPLHAPLPTPTFRLFKSHSGVPIAPSDPSSPKPLERSLI